MRDLLIKRGKGNGCQCWKNLRQLAQRMTFILEKGRRTNHREGGSRAAGEKWGDHQPWEVGRTFIAMASEESASEYRENQTFNEG